MLVYLFELDSVRNSAEEIRKGQQALFEEIVINGNHVVLSFNQLTDSKAFLDILRERETYECIVELFKHGVLRVSQYRNIRTASQYIQNAIEKCLQSNSDAFLFSGIPVKCTHKALLEKIKRSLAYGDLTLLEETRNTFEVESTEWEKIDYIMRYVRMILILSMEKLAMNPGKENIEYSFIDYMNEIILICESETDQRLTQCAKLLSEIKEQLDSIQCSNNRTNWINYINEFDESEIANMAEAMVDLCYNYTIEESISGVARHFLDREGFKKDLLNRFYQYWEEYQRKIHFFHKGDSEQVAETEAGVLFWDTAVRVADSHLLEEEKEYEKAYDSQKKKWRWSRNIRIGKWFATAAFYIIVFFLVDYVLGCIEEQFLVTLTSVRINKIIGAVVDTFCFGVLGSWLSEKFGLVDVLECVKNIKIGCKDIYRVKNTEIGIAYKRNKL